MIDFVYLLGTVVKVNSTMVAVEQKRIGYIFSIQKCCLLLFILTLLLNSFNYHVDGDR